MKWPNARKRGDIYVFVWIAVLLRLTSFAMTAEYSLVVPKSAVAGLSLKAILYIHGNDQEQLSVQINVLDNDSNSRHTSTIVADTNEAAEIEIQIGNHWLPGTYRLTAEAADGSFNASAEFVVIKKSRSILIQTDKAKYKPSQTVKFRVLVTTPDLKPLNATVNVTVQDSQGHMIIQWANSPTTMGVAEFALPLSDQPPLGQWKITALTGNQGSAKNFEVAEYTLPRFAVTVDLPTYITVKHTHLYGSISAVYTYGESVQGRANVSFNLGARKLVKIIQVYGKTTFELTPADLNVLGVRGSASSSITVVANVTEALTGISLTGSSTVPVSEFGAQVTFLQTTSDYFKRGLDYTAYVKVSQPDGAPLGADNLQLAVTAYYNTWTYVTRHPALNDSGSSRIPSFGLSMQTVTIFSSNVSVPDYGIASVNIPVPTSQRVSFTVQATVMYNGQSVSSTKFVDSFSVDGSNNIRVQLEGSADSLKSGDRVSLRVKLLQQPNEYYYIASAKGRIVSLSQSPLKTETFDVVLTEANAPQTTFLVYTRGADNEIVADSVTVNVAGAFRNKVDVFFQDSRGSNATDAKPGEEVTLQVRSDPLSLVGVLSVDESVLLLQGGNDINKDQLLAELISYTNDQSSTQGQASPFLDFLWPRWGGSSSRGIFTDAGLTIVTDATLAESASIWLMSNALPAAMGGVIAMEKVPSALPSMAENPETTVRTRSFFPETWIWSLLMLNSTGCGSITQATPDTITSWVTTAFSMNAESGLAVTPTSSKFKVFQNFFVSTILPYSVVRGERFPLKVVVFNYMDTQQIVKVTLQSSEEFNITTESGDPYRNLSLDVAVSARNGSSVQFWIKPIVLGSVKILVSALSANGGDRIEDRILVKPEGVQQGYCLSDFVLLRANGVYNHSFLIQYPSNVVSDSRRVEVRTSGDIMSSSIEGLEGLVQVPYGCGEQNMITFSPNIFVRKYLDAAGLFDADLVQRTQNNMLLGYQRELTYWRTDGFFSAFGDSDDAGSTWLTAFVLKSFRQAQKYLSNSIDQSVLDTAKSKILQQRMNSNGSFAELGRVIHSDMQGGSSSGLALTAYVLIALLEDNPSISDVLSLTVRTRTLLENSLPNLNKEAYTLAIATYALTLSNSSKATQALNMLERLATTSGDGGIYWSPNAADQPPISTCYYCPRASAASEVEMTSYALLTYVHNANVVKASQVAKWLANRRNSLGGYSSTQDTILALQSLSAYSSLVRPSDMTLSVAFATDNSEEIPRIFINNDNSLIQQTVQVSHPETLGGITFTANGRGSAIVSVCISFNVITVPSEPVVDTRVTVVPATAASPLTKLEACAKNVANGVSSQGMGIIQIDLASGFTVENGAVRSVNARRIEYTDSSVLLYYDKFNASWTCATVTMQQTIGVKAVKNAHVKAYPYYNPEQNMIVAYNPISGVAAISTTLVPKLTTKPSATKVVTSTRPTPTLTQTTPAKAITTKRPSTTKKPQSVTTVITGRQTSTKMPTTLMFTTKRPVSTKKSVATTIATGRPLSTNNRPRLAVPPGILRRRG